MVSLRLIELNDDVVIYEYYPEKKESPGKIGLNLKTGERIFIEESTEDFGRRYAAHAIRKVEGYKNANKFEETGFVAWY